MSSLFINRNRFSTKCANSIMFDRPTQQKILAVLDLRDFKNQLVVILLGGYLYLTDFLEI